MAEVEKAAPVDAPKQDPEQEPEKKDPPAPKMYGQEEVDRIAAKVRKNAQRDAELKFRREQEQRQQQQQPPKEEPKEEAEPKREDFDDHETFQRALTAFDARKATRDENAKLKAEEKERQQREAQDKAARTWHSKIEKAMEKHPDFEQVLEDNQAVMEVIYPMRGFIAESEIGPEIVRHLCLHPDEAKRIAELPRYKQGAAIDKIETDLLAADKPKPKEGDQNEDDPENPEPELKEEPERDGKGHFVKKDPPPPIEPGSGRPASSSSLPSDKDDPETWRRKELARIRKLSGK